MVTEIQKDMSCCVFGRECLDSDIKNSE